MTHCPSCGSHRTWQHWDGGKMVLVCDGCGYRSDHPLQVIREAA